ncbi:FtsW/RodA/SpoVE family cell cycle protein [Candidatus Saccharibacteria bacterium]|nr:FtsW/RodA/SpoVE family cell cycle protein [Candidatus Saccharibacteria bacterium]
MRKHRVDTVLVVLVVLFFAFGLLMMYAIGPRVALAEGRPENSYFVGHVRSIAMAVAALLLGAIVIWRGKIATFVKEHRTQLIKGLLYAALLLNLYAAAGRWGLPLTHCELGACRWLNIGFSFQPSELLKVAMTLYMAWLIGDRKTKGTYGKAEFWVPVACYALAVVFIVGFLQKDLGNTVVTLFVMAVMTFVAGITWRQFAILAATAIVALFALMNFGDSAHREERMSSFLNGSYHGDNALVSFGTGGLTGVGIGNSVSATGYLPEAISDSIYPIIGEIFGYFGAMAVLLCYVLMLSRILAVAHRSEATEDRMVALGLFAWILAHVIMHIGGMTGLIPMKGTTLPFLSYGGSSLMCLAFVYGIVLQKSCWTKREDINHENSGSRGRQWGTRYTGHRRSA